MRRWLSAPVSCDRTARACRTARATKRKGSSTRSIASLATTYRMTDPQAAIGIVQLEKLDRLLCRRREIARAYDDAFRSSPAIQVPARPDYAEHAFQSYAIRLVGCDCAARDAAMRELIAAGVSCRRGIPPIHLEPLYRTAPVGAPLPVAEAVAAQSIFLPIFGGLEPADCRRVADAVLKAVR
jgi:Predicted pyridoxal phosphate-dependent enzyme apparently involved in regulation of cell wall biogenesis